MSTFLRGLLAGIVAITALVAANPALAQEETGASAEDVAHQLANPNATLGFMAFPIDYTRYRGDAQGASDQSALRISFQPSVPYPLSESTNFFVRPLVPIFVDQPVPVVGGESTSPGGDVGTEEFGSTGTQLGDIGFDAAIGHTLSNGMVLFGGMVGTLPTGTDDRISLNQYLLGPEAFIGRASEWGFVGVLLSHQWDVAGEDAYDTSITAGQYFYTINLKNAWQIQAQPTFSYNHEAESGNRWSFPLGTGISKTVIAGTTPLKFSLQYWYYLESPKAFGTDHQVRFQVMPVIPLPW